MKIQYSKNKLLSILLPRTSKGLDKSSLLFQVKSIPRSSEFLELEQITFDIKYCTDFSYVKIKITTKIPSYFQSVKPVYQDWFSLSVRF